MASVTIRIVKNDLPALAAKLPIARRTILARRGQEMVEIAKQRSRVDTGEMQAGWEWVETNEGGRLQNEVAHTEYNEYGTVHMSAQPMARPAAEQVFPEIVADFSHLESMWL